jgi:hypothetical protein
VGGARGDHRDGDRIHDRRQPAPAGRMMAVTTFTVQVWPGA